MRGKQPGDQRNERKKNKKSSSGVLSAVVGLKRRWQFQGNTSRDATDERPRKKCVGGKVNGKLTDKNSIFQPENKRLAGPTSNERGKNKKEPR